MPKRNAGEPRAKAAGQGRRQAAGMAGSNRPAELLGLYAQMMLIRRAEERLSVMFSDGEVPGFIHLSNGQEAISVGVMRSLGATDTIASTHRGHGHAIAKGLSLDGFFSELLARCGGVCRGRGGSMHVADMSVGMLGANGIVGAGLPIALGSALASSVLKQDRIAAAFIGDGALAEGTLHESLNLAALWKLPLLLVCENNGYGEFLPTSKQLAFNLESLAAAYGLPYRRADGNDVEVVAAVAAEAVDHIRAGGAPRVLEFMTTRIRGHFEGDSQKYRDPSEIASMEALDPLRRAAERLQELGIRPDELEAIRSGVDARIAEAVEAARRSPAATMKSAIADVYAGKDAA